MPKRILVVEDSRPQAEQLKPVLEGAGHDVEVELDGEAVMAAVEAIPVDAVVSPIVMPGADALAQRLRSALEIIPDVLFSVDASLGNLFYISPAAERLFGYTPDEMLADPELWRRSTHPDDLPELLATFNKASDSGLPQTVECRFRPRAGDWRWLQLDVATVPDDSRAQVRVDGVARDVTRRKSAEDALKRSEAYFRSLIENVTDLITITEADGTIRYASPSVERILGYRPEERIGRTVFELVHPDDAERVARVMAEGVREGGVTAAVAYRYRHRDGTWRHLESVGINLLADPAVSGLVIDSRDITEGVALEEQLRQAQKMEAVGQLAGGIAHDFNNLLTVVLANTDLIAASLPRECEISEELRDVQAAAQHGQAMVRKLMGFARQGDLELRPADLGLLTEDIGRTLRRVLPDNVAVEISAEAKLPAVLADGGAVEQVLLNLATNARDAMPDGGSLRIEVVREVVGDLVPAELAGLTAGEYVCIVVTDTGIGMDAAVRQRLFEPFFTTKPPGLGTGLGMAMVYGIARQHNGCVYVNSEPGQGTAVRLFFPVAGGSAPALAPRLAPSDSAAQGGTEAVLVVEDEVRLRRVARRILEKYGYRVYTAADGEEALQVLAEHPAGVDLVFTDLVMPKLGGAALYQRVRTELGPMRFLVASGYSGLEAQEKQGLPADVPFVNKPWTLAELLASVRAALDAPVAASSIAAAASGATVPTAP